MMDSGAEPILDPEQALIQFKQDERYRDFFSEDFEVGKYIQRFLSETKKSDFLVSSLFQLDQLIKLQIAGGKESLLREAGALETAAGLDQSVREVSQSVTQLQSQVTRVAAQLTGPAQLLATRTRQLPRVQDASHVLRRVGQYMTLWKKLSALQSSGESDGRGEQLIRAAQYLVQCDQLGSSTELHGVHVIERMQLQLSARKNSVMEQAVSAFMKGIELRSHHVISTSLLVFYHFHMLLDMLHLSVHVIVQDLLAFAATQLALGTGQHKVKQHHVITSISPEMQALFMKSYQSNNAAARTDLRANNSTTGSPLPRAASHVTGSIWTVLGKISDKIEDKWSELITIMRAVVRLHVPDRINANIVSLLAEQLGHESRDFELDTLHVIDELFIRSFWKSFSTHFSEMISHVIRVKSVNASPMQYEALALEYPRVYALLAELSLKIDAQFDQVQVRTKTSKQSRDTATRLLREVFSAAESEYHTSTRNTVFRGVELCFNKLAKLAAPNTAPTVLVEDAEKCPYLSELLQCSHVIKQLIDKCLLYPTSLDGTDTLGQRLVKTVCSALRPLSTKVSEVVARDTSINQGSDGVTWHSNHVILHNSVVQFIQHTRDTVLATYSAALMQPLRESIDQIEHVINQSVIEPMFSRFMKSCEKTLLMVQKTEFTATTDSDVANNSFVSPYMKLLKRQLQQFKSLLDKLMQTPFIVEKVRTTQAWLTELFLRHVSLLPPLEGSGKLTLTGDIAQFEVSVMALFSEPCAQLQWIKWFKQLLFRDSADISGTLPEVSRLPPALVWHHLLARLGAERPPSVLNKSVAQWLEYWSQHSEEELWRVAVKCLEQYQSAANKSGIKQYSPLLPVTLSLGPQLIAAWHVNK